MTRFSIITAGLALAAGLAVPADARDKGEWRAATPSGEPVSCLQLTNIRETRVRDDSTIDFYTRDGRVYRNTLSGSCPSLGFEQRFTYSTSLSQLCSVDIITVLYQTPGLQRGASCGLGKFQPVTGAPK